MNITFLPSPIRAAAHRQRQVIRSPLAEHAFESAFDWASFRRGFLVSPSITKLRVFGIPALQCSASQIDALSKQLILLNKCPYSGCVADLPARSILRRKASEKTCVLCSAAAYCCGAVGPRPIAALLGRFLPRLGPLVHSSGPFFLPRHSGARLLARTRNPSGHICWRPSDSGFASRPGMTEDREVYSAAAWNGPRSPSGTCASASARAAKSARTCAKRGLRSRRRSSM
jgi:hypothetical protein